MKLTISDFAMLTDPVAVIIHSLDQALYQLTARVDGEERLLVEDDGKPYRSRNLQQIREVLQLLPVASITLRQESAYDEMIGQPCREEKNTLEILFSLNTQQQGNLH